MGGEREQMEVLLLGVAFSRKNPPGSSVPCPSALDIFYGWLITLSALLRCATPESRERGNVSQMFFKEVVVPSWCCFWQHLTGLSGFLVLSKHLLGDVFLQETVLALVLFFWELLVQPFVQVGTAPGSSGF